MSGGRHRGAGPEDATLFAPAALPGLREAAGDLTWLLGRGYALASTLALVGNRHGLDSRQRLALQRSCCSPAELAARRARALAPGELRGLSLSIDGFNLLVTLEVALGGGVVLRGADGCLRDLAGLRGSYHLVDETERAIDLVGETLAALGPARAEVLLDAPVSNSGRLKALLLERAATWPFPVVVELVSDPDPLLCQRTGVVTADSMILDRCGRWANLTAWVQERHHPAAWVVDLGGGL